MLTSSVKMLDEAVSSTIEKYLFTWRFAFVLAICKSYLVCQQCYQYRISHYIVIRIFSSIKLTLCKHNVVDQLNQIDYMTQQGMMLIHTTLFSVIMTCKLLMNLIILHYHILECWRHSSVSTSCISGMKMGNKIELKEEEIETRCGCFPASLFLTSHFDSKLHL